MMMKSYSLEQRLFFVKTYYRNGESITVTLRKCRTKYGQHFTLARETLRQLIKKFEQTGSLADRAIPGRPRTGRTSHNIAAVRNSVDADPTISTRRRAQQLGLSTSTVHLILKEELHVHSHRVQITQQLASGAILDLKYRVYEIPVEA